MSTAAERSARRRATLGLIRVEVEVRSACAAHAIRRLAREDRAAADRAPPPGPVGSSGDGAAGRVDQAALLSKTIAELIGPAPSTALIKRALGMAAILSDAAMRDRTLSGGEAI
ncbi:MAG: hypothetical protein PHT60_16410 [Acidiphilium sp.]|nr:hypothetical protein [Acidiphilium sp.]